MQLHIIQSLEHCRINNTFYSIFLLCSLLPEKATAVTLQMSNWTLKCFKNTLWLFRHYHHEEHLDLTELNVSHNNDPGWRKWWNPWRKMFNVSSLLGMAENLVTQKIRIVFQTLIWQNTHLSFLDTYWKNSIFLKIVSFILNVNTFQIFGDSRSLRENKHQ